jgi:predicted nucleic acid-binding protein
MTNVPKKYWDSSLFICFLNRDEDNRRKICEDILQHARDGELIIYTSTWTIVEVIRPRKQSLPSAEKLTPDQIAKIQGMFEWDWLKKIQVDERVAKKAVELCRDYDIHPSDAIHAASAILNGVNALQKWDRDFSKIAHLIKIEEPNFLTDQLLLIEKSKEQFIGPHPEDFTPKTRVVRIKGKKDLSLEKEPEDPKKEDPERTKESD